MTQFTELDFYKSMLNLQYKATEIAKDNCPKIIDGKIAYPASDGGMDKVKKDIQCLENALRILKEDNY